MNRAERRHRTEKIAKKRFKKLYCGFCGTPENWFHKMPKIKQQRAYGFCRNHGKGWACRCEYCFGGLFLKKSVSDLNFQEGIKESLKEKILQPIPNVCDASSVGPYDQKHEYWHRCLKPWSKIWDADSKHHS
jgi:hypothetical protein